MIIKHTEKSKNRCQIVTIASTAIKMIVPKTPGTFDEKDENIDHFDEHIIPDTYIVKLQIDKGGASSSFTNEAQINED